MERPPQHVVDQYALIKRTEAIQDVVDAQKQNRRVNFQARRQDVQSSYQLSNDSKYSWDVEVDGDGSGDEHAGRSRGLTWVKRLPTAIDLPHAATSPP